MNSNLFNIETEIDKEFSYAGGRRHECRAKGLKPFTKEFRDCLKGLRTEDKGENRAEKKKKKSERLNDLNDAIVEGKVKKTGFGKAFNFLKKINPLFLVMREPFLLLLRLNIWGIATKIANLEKLSVTNTKAKEVWHEILLHWIKFGGDVVKFKKNIDIGKTKKELLVRKKKQVALMKFDGDYFSNVSATSIAAGGGSAVAAGATLLAASNPAGAASTAGAVAASSPVWYPIVTSLGKVTDLIGGMSKGSQSDQAQVTSDSSTEKIDPSSMVSDSDATIELTRQQKEAGLPITGHDKGMSNTLKYSLIGGVILLVIIAIGVSISKSK